MATKLQNGGFLVGGKAAFGPDNGLMTSYPIANSYGNDLAPGDPVKVIAGGTVVLASGSTDTVAGVFVGPKTENQPTFIPLNYFASGTSARPSAQLGTTQITALVKPATGTLFEVQADASVTAGDVGLNFNYSVSAPAALGQAPNIHKFSTIRLTASSRTAGVGACKIMGLSPREGNSWADAYPIVLVKFNKTIDNSVSLG